MASIESNCVDAILPRNSRQGLKITMLDTIDFLEKKTEIITVLIDNLTASDSKHKYIFLDIFLDENTDNVGKKFYLCIFLAIPRLNLKILTTTINIYNDIHKSNINFCKLYVGLDEEDRTEQPDCSFNVSGGDIKDKYHIDILFNKSVSDSEIAFINRDGIPMPYASEPINISDLC
jgi:hypothetical protein